MWGKIDRNARSFGRIERMAQRALLTMQYAHENPKAAAQNAEAESPWSSVTASQFAVHLIYKSKKPVSENLILKRMRENNVFTPYNLINRLMVELIGEGVITSVKGKGYDLTDEMKKLVEEVKDKPLVELIPRKKFDTTSELAKSLHEAALATEPNPDWKFEQQLVNVMYKDQTGIWNQSRVEDHVFGNGLNLAIDRLNDAGVLVKVCDTQVHYRLSQNFLEFMNPAASV